MQPSRRSTRAIVAMLTGAMLWLAAGVGPSLAVDPTPTVTWFSSWSSHGTVGWSVNLSPTVQPAVDGGSMELYINDELYTSIPVQPGGSGVSTFWTPEAPGDYEIQAFYLGTAAFAPSSSPVMSITVLNPSPSSVTVTASDNPVGRNTDVTFTATVLPNPGPGTIHWILSGGDSTFEDPDAATELNASGVATWTTSFADAGVESITARFMGNDDWSPRPSDLYQLQVTGDAVTVGVSVPGSPVDPGAVSANVTITPNPGAGELRWRFCESCTDSGMTVVDADGTTSIPLGTLDIGNYQLIVDYSGSGNVGAGTGQTTFKVAAPSTTSLTRDRSVAYQGEVPVTLTATVASGVDITGGTVTFFDNVGGNIVQLGPVPVDPTTHKAVYASSALRVGSHSVTAKFNGETFIKVSTSPAVTFTVSADTAVHATFITPVGTFYPYTDGYRDTVKLSGVLSEKASVTVRIYNAGGSVVKTFSLGTKNPGAWSVLWGGRNAAGVKVPAGTYTAKVTFKDMKSHTKTINGKTVVSWRQAVWKSVTVTKYGEVGEYFVGEFGGNIYFSLDYPRGRILDSGEMIRDCTECGFAAARFTFQFRTTGVLGYRLMHLEGRGHGFSDREHPGTISIEDPVTQNLLFSHPLPEFDDPDVVYGVAFDTRALSPTKSITAWVWMDQAWGDAFDLNYVKLRYQYAVWKT